MVKKHFSISLLFIALAVLLGHNVIPHHHHHHNDFDGLETAHHHSTYHKHGNEHSGDDHDEEQSFKFCHLFFHYEHGATDIAVLGSFEKDKSLSKQPLQFFTLLPKSSLIWKYSILVRQKIPPYNVDFFSHQYFSPTSLRAPPLFIA
jgi:hypothetical protein